MKLENILIFPIILGVGLSGCESGEAEIPKSASGVKKASAKVQTNSDGLTVEQQNVIDRLKMDSEPGSIKHLYVRSTYTGQVLLYSTVKGKVTSSSKRLTPYSVAAADGQYVGGQMRGVLVDIGGHKHRTPEVLQDDGTYGSSIPYLFWWDESGRYYQKYVQGGESITVSDKPIANYDIQWKSTVEVVTKK